MARQRYAIQRGRRKVKEASPVTDTGRRSNAAEASRNHRLHDDNNDSDKPLAAKAQAKQEQGIKDEEPQGQDADDDDDSSENDDDEQEQVSSGEEYQEDQDNDASSSSEEEEDITTPATRKSARTKTRPTRMTNYDSGSEAEFTDDSHDEDDEVDQNHRRNTKSKSKGPKATAKLANPKQRPVLHIESSSEEEEKEKPSKARPKPKKRPTQRASKSKTQVKKKKKKKKKNTKSDSSEDEFQPQDEASLSSEDEEEEEDFVTPRRRPSRRRSTPSSKKQKHESSDDDSGEDEDDVATPRRTTRRTTRSSTKQKATTTTAIRSSPRHKNQPSWKLSNDSLQDFCSDEASSSDNNDDPKPTRRSTKKKKQDDDSDEEFVLHNGLDESASEASFDEDDPSSEEDDDLSVVVNTKKTKTKAKVKVKAHNVDQDEIGTADTSSSSESSEDDDDGNKKPRAKSSASPLDEITPRKKKSSHAASSDDSDDSDDSDQDHKDEDASPPKRRALCCPSTEDAVTAEPLPKYHVCCVAPDGASRQCFALDTLRQIALTKNSTQFLQPPHFRTPATDDFLDNIASIFGRSALDLRGAFYARRGRSGERMNQDDHDNDQLDFADIFNHNDDDNENDFSDHFRRYLDHQMGTTDIYCCPCCYKVYYDKEVEASHFVSSRVGDDFFDPMLVLEQHDAFQVAACFCFRKVADLKRHLRDDHQVDTSVVPKNDFYIRYKVRTQDGLLQRFLKRSNRLGTTRQGQMMGYWLSGNNQSFVHLLYLMKQAEHYRNALHGANSDDNDNDDEEAIREAAEAYFQSAYDFYESFQDRVQELWERLSSPFQEVQDDDMDDFLADDDEVQDEVPHYAMRNSIEAASSADQNDLVSKMERKYGENDTEYSGDEEEENAIDSEIDDEEAGEDGSDASPVNVEELNGYYSEVSEDEEQDEWVASIRKKKRRQSSQPSPAASTVATPKSGRKLKKLKRTPSSARSKASVSSQNTNGSRSSLVMKKRIHVLEDSDDDE